MGLRPIGTKPAVPTLRVSALTVSDTTTSPGAAITQPRGDVDRGPDRTVGRVDSFSRVDADADVDRIIGIEDLVGGAADDVERAVHGHACGWKDDVEAVAFGAESAP